MDSLRPQIQVNEHSAKAESALNKFFNLSLDLFCITEENGYFQQLSPAWETVLGWTVSELIRTPWIELIHPDDVEATLNTEQQWFQQNVVEYENRYRHHDGSYRWLSWRVLPDQDGLVYRVAKDITAAKQSEEALRDRLERETLKCQQIETALTTSEERFRCLTACSPVGIFLADVEGRCTYANPRLLSLLGLTLEDMLGKGWAQAVHPSDREWVFTEWSDCAVQGHECYQEYRFQTPQGLVRWVQARTSPMRSEQGELLGHVGTVEDITERKQAEEALRLSEKRYALAVSAGKIGVWDWNLETNEIYVDPSLKAMLGYEDNEIQNHIEVWGQLVHPDDREQVMAVANAHLEGMTPQYEVEHRMLHKDGSIRWFLACGTAIRDTHGKAIRMMGTDSDITERKQAEAELRKAYQQLTLHVDNSPLAILEWDNEFRLQRWSKQAERIFGWKATELLHKHPWDWGFIYREDAQVVDNVLGRLLDGTLEYTVDENRNYAKDGRIVHCQWYNSVLLDESGNLLSILSLVLDVTERKQAEAALQQVLTELETRVEERTAQLQQANEQLSAEIAERQRTEAALRHSEEQFRRVFDEAPIGMALTGTDKRFLRVNQALVEMLGYSTSELTNLTCEAITHPEDWIRVLPYLDRIARGDIDRFQIEERFLKQNQEILWGNLTSMVLRDESGQILYGLGMVEDITERRQAEADLRHSEEQFRRVFDEAPIGMSLADLNNRYIRVNRTFYEMLGYSESELMALTFEDITYPADLELEIPFMAQLLNGEIDSFGIEKRYLKKTQEIVWVNLTLIALRDHAGVVLYTLAMIEDITERKHAEEALRQSEARYRAIIEDQTELICRFQPDGTLTFVNDAYCRYFNKQASELMGHSFMPVISEEDQEFVAQKFGSLSVEQPIVTYEYRVILPSGETRWQQWTDRALFDDSGILLEFQAVGRDITKLKQAEAEILKALERERELSELRSGFVSLVSHEFRTPLTAIQSSAELLERYNHKLSDEKKQNHHRRIQNAVQRMTQLLEDVLTIGKAEAGKLQFTPSPMDLVAFCHDLVESLQISARPQHKINFVAVADGSDAQMDEKLLAHILTNLLSNAIKYSPDGGMVQFDLICDHPLGGAKGNRFALPLRGNRSVDGARGDRSWAIFRIQDSGIGIPPEDLERLFESFGRASNVGAIPGTGLGLAIVKKCVDLHGGQITVESEVGTGTTFTVTLPLKSPSDTISQGVTDKC